MLILIAFLLFILVLANNRARELLFGLIWLGLFLILCLVILTIVLGGLAFVVIVLIKIFT